MLSEVFVFGVNYYVVVCKSKVSLFFLIWCKTLFRLGKMVVFYFCLVMWLSRSYFSLMVRCLSSM